MTYTSVPLMNTYFDPRNSQGLGNDESARFLLLTFQNAEISFHDMTSGPNTDRVRGSLTIESVHYDGFGAFKMNSDKDAWLILRLNSLEISFPRKPIVHVEKIFDSALVIFEEAVSARKNEADCSLDNVKITLNSSGTDQAKFQDELDTLGVILSQYGALQAQGQGSTVTQNNYVVNAVADSLPEESTFTLTGTPADDVKEHDDYRGKLVLMDEESGEVFGTLGDQYILKEDPSIFSADAAKDTKEPVVITLPRDEDEQKLGGARAEVLVQTMSSDERDVMMKSARLISNGIISATSIVNTSVSSISSFYQSHTTPSQNALLADRAKQGVEALHNATDQAKKMSQKAMGWLGSKSRGSSDSGSSLFTPKIFGSSRVTSPSPITSPDSTPNEKTKSDQSLSLDRKFLDRLHLSTDIILDTLGSSAQSIVSTSTSSLTSALAHKFGTGTGEVSNSLKESTRSVALVYMDSKGTGRSALLRKTGKLYLRARVGDREVVLGAAGSERVNESEKP